MSDKYARYSMSTMNVPAQSHNYGVSKWQDGDSTVRFLPPRENEGIFHEYTEFWLKKFPGDDSKNAVNIVSPGKNSRVPCIGELVAELAATATDPYVQQWAFSDDGPRPQGKTIVNLVHREAGFTADGLPTVASFSVPSALRREFDTHADRVRKGQRGGFELLHPFHGCDLIVRCDSQQAGASRYSVTVLQTPVPIVSASDPKDAEAAVDLLISGQPNLAKLSAPKPPQAYWALIRKKMPKLAEFITLAPKTPTQREIYEAIIGGRVTLAPQVHHRLPQKIVDASATVSSPDDLDL